jgi:peroxiredoxin
MVDLGRVSAQRMLRILFAAGLVLVLSGQGGDVNAGLRKAEKPKQAPNFMLPTLEGTPLRLNSFRGKVVFLNFWATWCPPCRHEMPVMETLYREFKDSGFEVVAISIDTKGKESVASFAKKLKLTFPILLDREMAVMRQYEVRGLPATFLIDREGRIAQVAVGPRNWAGEEAKNRIRGLIRQGQQK